VPRSASGIDAKTHTGVWGPFADTFVKDGSFDASLYRRARRTEEDRLEGDYEAASLGSDLARLTWRPLRSSSTLWSAMVGDDHR
jgi:uncharacterized protein (UPF0332 family)